MKKFTLKAVMFAALFSLVLTSMPNTARAQKRQFEPATGPTIADALMVEGQQLIFAVSDSTQVGGYEVGSKQAPIAQRAVTNLNQNGVELTEMAFQSTQPLDPNTVGVALMSDSAAHGHRGLILWSRTYIGTDGLYHVSFNRGFGPQSAGLYLPPNTNALQLVFFCDIPLTSINGMGWILRKYETKPWKRKVLPQMFDANVEVAPSYTMEPVGTVGLIAPTNGVTVTLSYGGPAVPFFTVTSTTATTMYRLVSSPTWWGPGIDPSAMSAPISPGGSVPIDIRAQGMVFIPPGKYFGTQLIQADFNGATLTVPVTVIVQ
jgi:hypothetical protein